MLVQDYLRTGKTLEELKDVFGIKYCLHSTLPLVILNYDQIESTKTDPIVMECRGLILELDTWNIVARSFNRFFNLGECEELQKDFNWSDFFTLEKVDGSLINMFHYADEWHMATRGSFGEGLMENCNFSWKELFWNTFNRMGYDLSEYGKNTSFTWELCSRFNKIVTDYPEPVIYLLNWYVKDANRFMYRHEMNMMKGFMPNRYDFDSIENVMKYIEDLEVVDPTNEGVVLVDCNLNRIKVKNKKYLSLHKMRGESGFTMKNLLPFVLDGETDELFAYYPEVKPKVEEMIKILGDCQLQFTKEWGAVWHIEDQKEFAITLTNIGCLFSDVLFRAKKDGDIGNITSCWNRVLHNQKLYEKVFKKLDKENLE